MKVLHILPSFGLGGMEKVLCAIINRTPNFVRHAIVPINGCWEARKWIQRNDVSLIPFERPLGTISFFRALYQVIKSASPDILMTYNWGATDAIWLARMAGIQHILHSEHGFNVDEAKSTKWKRNLVRWIVYRCVTKLVVVSCDFERFLETKLGIPPDSILLISNGIDTDYFTPNVYDREKIRDELGVQPDDVVIGYAGRLDPVKNFPLLIDAFELTLRTNQNFKLLLIGEGPEREQIEKVCVDYGIQDHVRLVGKKERVLPFLQALDVFALTSFREQMPMSMLEAMAVGIPVVASAVGEIPTILDGQEAGFVHQLEEGVNTFSQSFLRLRDPELRKRMGGKGRRLVVSQFQEERMIRKYFELIEETVGRNLSQRR